MGHERSLLERLATAKGGTVERTMHEDTNALVRSVLRNLQHILNTRQGSSEAHLDLGIPAPSDIAHNFPEAISMMQRIIRECVEKYEPRLTNINVTHVESADDVLTLRFQVTARIATSKNQIFVSFDTLVDHTGHINLQQ